MMHAVLEYLLNAGWQLALVAAGAFMLSRLLKLVPAQECRLWLVAFGLGVLAPASAAMAGGGLAHGGAASIPGWLSRLSLWHGVVVPPWLALALVAGFWLCLAGGALRLAASCIIPGRFVAASTPLALPGDFVESLNRFCGNRGHDLPPIRCCAGISSPMVIGIRHPCVLVPPSLLEESPDKLRTALLHELAHVVRRDYAVNIAVELLALPLAWHPALHVIKGMIRRTREQSCDTMAATQIGCRRLYARNLLSLARQAIKPKPGAALGMFGDGDLPSRIASLVAARNWQRLTGRATAGTVATFLLLGAAVTLVHVSPLDPVPPILARSQPAVGTMAKHQVAVADVAPIRSAELREHKHRSRMQGLADQTVRRTSRDVAVNLVPSAPSDADSGGVLEFALPLELLKYRTIAP
jgi:Zn-dependent protease with chaperone function